MSWFKEEEFVKLKKISKTDITITKPKVRKFGNDYLEYFMSFYSEKDFEKFKKKAIENELNVALIVKKTKGNTNWKRCKRCGDAVYVRKGEIQKTKTCPKCGGNLSSRIVYRMWIRHEKD